MGTFHRRCQPVRIQLTFVTYILSTSHAEGFTARPSLPMASTHTVAAGIVSDALVARGSPLLPALDNTYGALFLGTAFGLMCVFKFVDRESFWD